MARGEKPEEVLEQRRRGDYYDDERTPTNDDEDPESQLVMMPTLGEEEMDGALAESADAGTKGSKKARPRGPASAGEVYMGDTPTRPRRQTLLFSATAIEVLNRKKTPQEKKSAAKLKLHGTLVGVAQGQSLPIGLKQ